MPTTVVTTPPTDESQPVPLAVAAAWLRLDDGLVGNPDPAAQAQLDGLAICLAAACEACENYTGRLFAGQTVEMTFSIYERYTPPLGGTATAVSGVFTNLEQLANLSGYLEEYRKGITVERQFPIGYEELGPTYTVTFTIDQAKVPASVKSAILELTGEWYRNREVTIADVRSITELPANYKVKLAPYRLAPLGNY